MAILTQVRDPRVQNVTVTAVEMDPDMRSATVHVSVMGSPAKEELALKGLANSAGFLQAQVAERIETRYTPRLKFKLDNGVKRSIEIARMLSEVLPPPSPVAVAVAPSQTPVSDEGTLSTASTVEEPVSPVGPVGLPVVSEDMEKPEERA